MIRIAVCDDDRNITNRMKEAIQVSLDKDKDCEYTIDTMADGATFMRENELQRYDIVFLDIEMPDMSGLEIIKRLHEKNKTQLVILVSDHEQLVYESIQYMPFRFIRKSYLQTELEEALEKAQEEIRERSQKCFFEINGKSQYVSLRDVIYFEAASHYAMIHFCEAREPEKIRITMEELFRKVQKYDFVRVHTSFVTNMRYIQAINGSDLALADGSIIHMSRRYKEQAKALYMEYLERL